VRLQDAGLNNPPALAAAVAFPRGAWEREMSDDFYDLSGMDARQAYPAMDGRYTRGQ